MKVQGVYEIRHVASGRVYVGSAVDVPMRWHIHRHHLRTGTHHSSRLQAAWSEFGAAAFSFTILEAVPNKKNLLAREQWWIDERNAAYLPVGFNCCAFAGSRLGSKHSPETIAKLRAAKLGKPAPWNRRKHTPEQIEANRRAKLGRKRGPMTAETKAKIAAKAMGNKRGAANKGNVRPEATPETRAKLSASHTGNTNSLGHQHSPATLAKMRASQTARRQREQTDRSHSSETAQAATSPARLLHVPP